jgi:glyceraldehyde-3-phosphate dehydrogenase (NAD(P))
MWEVAVWEDALSTNQRDANLTYQVHNEAIVVPENIDAIRALTGIETNWQKSVAKTNEALGIVKTFLPKTVPEGAVHAAMANRLEATRDEFRAVGFAGAEEPDELGP